MHNKQYDVYLIDLQMPKINGLELSKYILSVQPEAAILILQDLMCLHIIIY